MPAKASKADEVRDLAKRLLAAVEAGAPMPAEVRRMVGSSFGLLGASKGGKARAAKLSATKRKAIAKKAAKARWKGHTATPS